MSLFKRFHQSGYRLTILYFWSVALTAAVAMFVFQQGWVEQLIPYEPFVLGALGVMGFMFTWECGLRTLRCSPMVDRERRAVQALRAFLDEGSGDRMERVVALFRGEVDLGDTQVSKFINRLRRAKETNPRYPVEMGSFTALLESHLMRPIERINIGAAWQARYGLIGTFVGLAVGLGSLAPIAGQALTGDITSAMAGVLAMGVSVGVAILTTLFGTIGNTIAGKDFMRLREAVGELVDEVEVLVLSRVIPIINDPDKMAKVMERLKSSSEEEARDGS